MWESCQSWDLGLYYEQLPFCRAFTIGLYPSPPCDFPVNPARGGGGRYCSTSPIALRRRLRLGKQRREGLPAAWSAHLDAAVLSPHWGLALSGMEPTCSFFSRSLGVHLHHPQLSCAALFFGHCCLSATSSGWLFTLWVESACI